MSNQLIKTTEQGKENVFPRTRIQDLFDDTSGQKLIDILRSFNMMFVPYLGNKSYTRNQISPELRRQGLWLTYVIDNTVYTEWYDKVAIDDTNWGSDSNWRQGSNALVGDLSISPNGTWVINGEDSGITIKGDKGDSPVIRIYDNKIQVSYDNGVTYEDLNNTPVYTKFRFNSQTNTYQVSYDLGANWQDISDEKVYHKFRYNSTTNTYQESTDFGKTWSNISAEKVYYQFRYNAETNTHQVSTDLGQNWTDVSSNKVYYQFRTNDNRLQVSTDLGTTWKNCSEPIAAWFRWASGDTADSVGKIQISRNQQNWSDLSPNMTNNLYIKGYVAAIGNLPSNAAIGDIYMVGPTYDESDTTHDYPHYRMWVKQSSGWVDNGEYQSNVIVTQDIINNTDTGNVPSTQAVRNYVNTEIINSDNILFCLNQIPYGEIKGGQVLEVNWKSDTALDNSGNERSSSGHNVTDYIEYNNAYSSLFSAIQVSFTNTSVSYINVAFYDIETKTFIKGFQCFGGDRIILIPRGMCVRIVQKTDLISDIIFSTNVYIKDIKSLMNEKVITLGNQINEVNNQINEVNNKVNFNAVNIENLNSDVYSIVEKDITSMFGGNNAYKTVIGSQPTLESNSFNISGQIFDNSRYKGFKLHSKGASTYRLWAKIKDDVVTEMASYSADFVDVDIYFDGTFDKLVINNYRGTVIGVSCESKINKINKIENELQKEVEEDITTEIMAATTAYTTVVGNAPSENNEISTQYGIKGKIFDVTDIKSFTLHSQSGGTCRLWAKVKNGLITEMANYSASAIDVNIENDGTFDQLVINLYGGTASKIKGVPYIEYTNEQIESLKNKVESVESLIQEKNALRILMFGNSFTHDSMGYVPYILKNMCPNFNIEIGIAFYSGCSLAQHLASLSGANVMLNEQQIVPQKYWYSLSINGEKWTTKYNVDGTEIIKDKDWDIITFQQNGSNAYSDWDIYFKPFIYKIQKLVYEKVNKSIKLGWVLTHGSYAGTNLETLEQHWQGTADNTQKIMQNTIVDFIMPYGTAIQNLRKVYSSSWGGQANLLGNDNVHMQEGLPALTAGYCHAIQILELAGIPISVVGDKQEVTKEWVEEYALGPNYYNDDIMTVDDSTRFIAQSCAIQAIKNPYAVTDISEIINNL